MGEIQQRVKEDKRSEDFSQQLQGCIDRLYELKDSVKGDVDINSCDALLITEDLVSILKAWLREISFPVPHEVNRKEYGVLSKREIKKPPRRIEV